MTATAVVGSAAEDTTPSEREAPQRFAWWHPRSADLGRHKARREEHARRNDLWARSPAQEEAPVIPRALPPPSASCVFAVLDGPVFAPVDPPTRHALARRARPPPPPVEPSTAAASSETKPQVPKKPDWLAIEPKKPASKPRGRHVQPDVRKEAAGHWPQTGSTLKIIRVSFL